MDYSDLVYIPEELGNSLSRTQVTNGDIVISQRGSLGQCAIIEDTFEKLNISANIIAIKNIKGTTAEFIHDYILSSIGQMQLERSASGQVQQKITTQDISDILIPVNCDEKNLTDIIKTANNQYNEKIKKAEKHIIDNKKSIENRFNLNKSENKLCFAVRLKNIDGVIDVKRYSTIGNLEHKLVISDICDVVDKRVNVSSFGNCIVDWIRIDDLQNQPLDIEQVRTMPATEIDGTFFEVQKDDILVARLGPTILNQKIVMVRNIERTTIASSEFLVLRCKKGYNPEAVMSILKTDYYMSLMYSNARGSTPSRYRLNRADMLKLPFPDIADVQDEVAENAISARETAKKLRVEAEQEWQAAKAQFEKELLGE